MKTATNFHHKVLRGILRLSPRSPIAPLYFLLGQLPFEASAHIDILILFLNIWQNPHTTVHKIVKYLLMMTDNSSLTWSAHLRIICQLYKLPDPLVLLSSPAWPSERWKSLVKISVTAHYESAWRSRAANNSRLGLLNVQTIGLSGRPHPVLSNILTTQEVMKSRIHIKMLAGDYPCQAFPIWGQYSMPSLSVILSHPPTTHRGHDPSVNQVQSHVRYQGQSYPRHAQ